MPLIASVSGIRGTVPDSLNFDTIRRFLAAFAKISGSGPIVVGRDGRPSGVGISQEVSRFLSSSGRQVFDIGIVPTPTVQMEILRRKAAGGVSISASHNPADWNGLKFLGASSMFLSAEMAELLIKLANDASLLGTPLTNATEPITIVNDAITDHIAKILSSRFIDADRIRTRHFRIVVDAVNAGGSVAIPQMLEALGCDVIRLYCDSSGIFPHTPEPLPQNLGDLCAAVVEHQADLGVAVDPDSDRLVLITEKGIPFGEEYTIVECVQPVLRKQPGTPVVINLSTTRAVADVAAQFGSQTVRTPVGEINVATAMQRNGSRIGGEGSGGIILAPLHLGRDALVGCALTLQNLVESEGTSTALRASLPSYAMIKQKYECASREDAEARLAAIADQFSAESIRRDDGIHITFSNNDWLHARSSNTEPIIRIIAEARTSTEAEALIARALHR